MNENNTQKNRNTQNNNIINNNTKLNKSRYYVFDDNRNNSYDIYSEKYSDNTQNNEYKYVNTSYDNRNNSYDIYSEKYADNTQNNEYKYANTSYDNRNNTNSKTMENINEYYYTNYKQNKYIKQYETHNISMNESKNEHTSNYNNKTKYDKHNNYVKNYTYNNRTYSELYKQNNNTYYDDNMQNNGYGKCNNKKNKYDALYNHNSNTKEHSYIKYGDTYYNKQNNVKMTYDNKEVYSIDNSTYQHKTSKIYTKYQEQETNFYNESTDKQRYEQYKSYIEKKMLVEEYNNHRNNFYSNIKIEPINEKKESSNIDSKECKQVYVNKDTKDKRNDYERNIIENETNKNDTMSNGSTITIENTRECNIESNNEKYIFESKSDIQKINQIESNNEKCILESKSEIQNINQIESNNEKCIFKSNNKIQNINQIESNNEKCICKSNNEIQNINNIENDNKKCILESKSDIQNKNTDKKTSIEQTKVVIHKKCTLKDIKKYNMQYVKIKNEYENLVKAPHKKIHLQAIEKKIKRKIKKIEKYDLLVFPFIVQFINNKKVKCSINKNEFAYCNTPPETINTQPSSNNSMLTSTIFDNVHNKNLLFKDVVDNNLHKKKDDIESFVDYIKDIKPDLCNETAIKEYANQQKKISYANNIKNKAQKIQNCDKMIEYEIIDEIEEIQEKEWSKNEINVFESMKNSRKDFIAIQQRLKKDIKEIVLHYYRSKKTKVEKRKAGRISDDEMKKIIEKNWSEKEINKFVNCVVCFGREWKMYATIFPNKQEKDYKLLYRYANKYRNIETKTKKQHNSQKSTIVEDCLRNFKVNEKQLFAIYFPFIGKNWSEMAQYINKSANELRMYYKFYYKNLTENEKKFETYTREMHNETLTCPNSPKRSVEENNICGIIFKTNKK